MEENHPTKLLIAYNTVVLKGILEKSISDENNKISVDPFSRIITSYEEIKEILEMKEQYLLEFLYYNRNKIHNILYDEERIIPIDLIQSDKNLFFYFFLSLLIKENECIINYLYSLDLIKQITEIQKYNEDKIYLNFILSKIFSDLIINYKMNKEDEDEKEVIQNMESENLSKLKYYYIKCCNELGEKNISSKIGEIISKRVDEIYIKIISILIEKRKLEDYEFTFNIIKQLDLDNINITKKIFDILSNILNKKENYINDYAILSSNDLINTNKINFFYTLFLLIKQSFLIYHNSFLLKTKKTIIQIIKHDTNIKEIFDYLDNNNKEKLKFIIKIFIDSNYYYEKYLQNREEDKVISIQSSYSRAFREVSFKKNNNSLKGKSMVSENQKQNQNQVIVKIDEEPSYKILENSSFTFRILDNEGNYQFTINKMNNLNNTNLTFETLREVKLSESSQKLRNSYKKFLNFFYDFLICFQNNVSQYYTLEIILEFNMDKADEFEKKEFYNINLTYKFNNNLFKDYNILTFDTIEQGEGFLFLIEEING